MTWTARPGRGRVRGSRMPGDKVRMTPDVDSDQRAG